MDIQQVNQAVEEMRDAFAAIQQPRSDFAIRHFVVGQHDTDTREYSQCVLELQIKYNNIRRALLTERKLQIEIQKLLDSGDEIKNIEAEEKQIDLEETRLAMQGAFREFECLYAIFRSFPKQYSYEELQAAEAEYWHKRLNRQAAQELLAGGRVGVGNQEALAQIGQRFNGAQTDVDRVLAQFLSAALPLPTENTPD
jgi:hypothetical protein